MDFNSYYDSMAKEILRELKVAVQPKQRLNGGMRKSKKLEVVNNMEIMKAAISLYQRIFHRLK